MKKTIVKSKSGERVIQFPMDRYAYFRDALRPATEARRELMGHLQTLIEQETKRHQDAWDEIARIAGFLSATDMHAKAKEIFVDWQNCILIIRDRKK